MKAISIMLSSVEHYACREKTHGKTEISHVATHRHCNMLQLIGAE
jgi:hypothetical protein